MTSPKLKRVLGLTALTFYGVGDILGAGIYALIGKVAGIVGAAVWASFLVAFFVAAMTALSYAELCSRIPRSAGAAVFTLEAFGKKWLSYGVGVLLLFSGLVSMGAGSRAFAGYLTRLVPALPENAVIFLFFFGLAAINLIGIKESSRANIVCTLIEMAGLFIVIAAGVKFFGKADLLTVAAPETPGHAPAVAILQGGVLAFYAFVGFEDLANVAEETKDPERNMPRAILLALSLGAVIYMLVAVAAVSVLPPAELAASKAPLVDVVQKGFPWFPVWAFSLIALFAVANTALLNFIMGSRVLYGMSSDRLLPAALGKVHPKTGTPYFAILVIWAVALVIAYSGSLVVLARSTSLILLCVFLLVNASLIALKLRPTAPTAAFKVPLAVPILGILSCSVLLIFAWPV